VKAALTRHGLAFPAKHVQQLLSEAISSLAANIETKALGIQQECDHD